jgi:CBS domain-containing protein
MSTSVRELMRPNPVVLPASASVSKAAHAMRDRNIGDVIVEKGGKLCGIVTDRDIVVRALAEGKDPNKTSLDEICSHEVATLTPDATTEEAVTIIRHKAVRRIPVVENEKPVGIVSIGDLAIRLDPSSALADLSAAPPNR